ncbi:MAG: aspartate carbamoyltransferase catalytic subunit [Candidatus Saccharimonas sp.]
MERHILSVERYTPQNLEQLFASADELRRKYRDPLERQTLASRYIGHQMVSLFYESSTRTRLSFEIAAGALGVHVSGTESARLFSSASKGETLEDTIQVLNQYGADIIVLRHNETGAAARAAAVSDYSSVINAGDGMGEHPTQAALDLYTIQQTKGRLDSLKVVIGGDLLHGRTARSLAKLLAQYPGNVIRFVSTPELQIDDEIKQFLQVHDTAFTETDDMLASFADADVVYWTRLQTERLTGTEQSIASHFVIDQAALDVLPKYSVIMHPLPRVGEITVAVDHDPRAKYFQQAGNGLYVRMAMIDQILRS